MAHEIESMFSLRAMPWHGLGKVVQDAPTIREALQFASLDWSVEKEPLHTESGSAIETHCATVRSSDRTVIGVVGVNYQPVQNIEAFEFLDALKEEGTLTWETAGSLRGGSRVWVTAQLGEDIRLPHGDSIKKYLTFANGHDGSLAVTILRSPIRVVCANTLRMAMDQSDSTKATLKHTRNVLSRLDEVRVAIGLALPAFKQLQVTASYLAGEAISRAKLDQFFDRFLPLDKGATARGVTRTNNAREQVLSLIESPTNKGKDADGTLWGLFNAASEWVCWEASREASDPWERALFGNVEGRTQVAWDSVLELV